MNWAPAEEKDRGKAVEKLLVKVQAIESLLEDRPRHQSIEILDVYLSAIRQGIKGISPDIHFKAIEVTDKLSFLDNPMGTKAERGKIIDKSEQLQEMVRDLIHDVAKNDLINTSGLTSPSKQVSSRVS